MLKRPLLALLIVSGIGLLAVCFIIGKCTRYFKRHKVSSRIDQKPTAASNMSKI